MSPDPDQLRLAPIVRVEEPNRTPLLLVIASSIEIGRDCAGVVLTEPALSRRHLTLEVHDGTVLVTDLGTTNGSTLGGEPLKPQHRLALGDTVRFGRCTLQLAAPAAVRGERSRSAPRTSVTATETVDLRATSIERVADAVLADPLSGPSEPDAGTVTVVFSDIEGSTTRAVELGDTGWMEVLEAHNTIVRRMLARHGGIEVKSQGDGFMLRFRSARSAISCMCDVQRALAAYAAAQPMNAVRIRAGVHTGEVILGDDGDIYGRHVIMAARISGEARGGEVLVSSLVREIVEPRGDVEFGPGRTVSLKGLGVEHLVHPVRW